MSNNIYSKYTQLINSKLEEIQQHFNCTHVGITEMRRRINAAGAVSIAEQCRRCGQQIKAVPKRHYTSAQIEAMPEYDNDLAQRYWNQRLDEQQSWREYYQQQQQAELESARNEYQRYYETYIRSTAWQIKRNLVMKRAGGICEGCGVNRASQVHHLTYEHLGDEFLWELRAVCRQCHERIHDIAPLQKEA